MFCKTNKPKASLINAVRDQVGFQVNPSRGKSQGYWLIIFFNVESFKNQNTADLMTQYYIFIYIKAENNTLFPIWQSPA
jgi:hypothetical protein